jgi:hypothetical protein
VKPPPPGSKTVTIIDGSSGTRKEYTIPGGGDGGSQRPLLDPELIEGTRHGAIPKVGPDGVRPSSRYAHPRELPAGKKDSPIIAIVIGGLGISASALPTRSPSFRQAWHSPWHLMAPTLKSSPTVRAPTRTTVAAGADGAI